MKTLVPKDGRPQPFSRSTIEPADLDSRETALTSEVNVPKTLIQSTAFQVMPNREWDKQMTRVVQLFLYGAFLLTLVSCGREPQAPSKPDGLIEKVSIEPIARELGLDPSLIYKLQVTGEPVKAMPGSKAESWGVGALGHWVTVHVVDEKRLEKPLVYRCSRMPRNLELDAKEPMELFGHLHVFSWGQAKPSTVAGKHAIPPPFPISEQALTSTSAHGRDFAIEVRIVLLGQITEFGLDEFPPRDWHWTEEMIERYVEKEKNRGAH